MNRISIAAGSLVVLVAASLIAFLPGCGKPPDSDSSGNVKSFRKVEPWESIAVRLRRDTELAACKTALGQLNNELAERTDLPPVPALAPEGETALKALVPLSSDDLMELRGASYSALDPAYLAECFYLRDAARSLDPGGLPPLELARLGFAWLCRQVYLQPWELEREGFIPAVPPEFTLNRGSGSGLERAYVFLALLQQMGLDGCLIGATDQGTIRMSNDRSLVHDGPFRAVGVRIGADIFLFNPFSGEPFAGPDGKGVATYAQVKANPGPWKLTEVDAKKMGIALAVPLSSLAPRIALLESKILADTGVRLAFDAAALKARFPAEAKFWNPPQDRFSYTRLLITFLPVEEGGIDHEPRPQQPFTHYKRSQIPKSLVDLPPDLNSGVAERLRLGILNVYGSSFFVPPTPRERIQRGQFQDASRDLTQKLGAFGRGQERLRAIDPADVTAWLDQAAGSFELVSRARFPNPGQTVPQPDSDPDVIDAKNKLEEFWRATDNISRALVDRSTASLGRGEALFLLALAKHEEAERRQTRGAAEALDAWREADNSWSAFLEQDGTHGTPGRTAHAKLLAARAKQFAMAK